MWDIYRPRSKCKYKFEKCGRLDRECLWMSNRRRPQLKQEVNSKISRYVTFYVGFMKQKYGEVWEPVPLESLES